MHEALVEHRCATCHHDFLVPKQRPFACPICSLKERGQRAARADVEPAQSIVHWNELE